MLPDTFFRELAEMLNERLDITGEPGDMARAIVVAASVICDAIYDILPPEDDDADG